MQLLALLLLLLLVQPAQAAPNVLLVYCDDCNDWMIGNHPQAVTPNIDALRAQSIDFTDAHTGGSVCRVARTSLLTGLTPWQTGTLGNLSPPLRQSLKPDAKTLNQHLSARGYWTEAIGKIDHRGEMAAEWDAHDHNYGTRDFHVAAREAGHTWPPRLKSFDQPDLDWGWLAGVPERFYKDRAMIDRATARLATLPTNRPWLYAVGLRQTHLPLLCPGRFHNLYPTSPFIIVPNTPPGDLNDVGPRLREWIDGDSEYRAVLDAGLEKSMVRSYLACVSFMDDLIGRLIVALDASVHGDRTIVVLVSDHGYHLFTKSRVGKNTPWAESTRVPFMIRIPGVAARIVPQVVSTSSLLPTLMELLGAPVVSSYPSLVPLIRNEHYEPVPASVASFLADAYITGRFLLVRERPIGDRVPHLELYRRDVDPLSVINIAPQTPGLAERFRAELEAVIKP